MSRSRARQPGTEPEPASPVPSATAPQLIKAAASEPAVSSGAQAPAANPTPVNGAASDRPEEIWPRKVNGFAGNGTGERYTDAPQVALPDQPPPVSQVPPGQANGDQRRTLHLSLGNASPGNGGTVPSENHQAERHNPADDGHHSGHHFQTTGERFAPPADPGLQDRPPAPDRGRDGIDGAGVPEARPAAYSGPIQRTDAGVAHRKDGGGSYIDKDLRARVDGDIAAFLAAFDAALVEDTQESRSALREATDRLLRAGARTRIELERLEARMPLPPRDNVARNDTAWRHR